MTWTQAESKEWKKNEWMEIMSLNSIFPELLTMMSSKEESITS